MTKKLGEYKLTSLAVALLLMTLPVNAFAYSSPYYATRFIDSGPLGNSSQIIAKGNTVYVSSYGTCQIYKILNESIVQNVAGLSSNCGFDPDGSIANQSRLVSPSSIDVGSDGTIYIAEATSHRVRAILPDGTLKTIAGNGSRSPNSLLRTDAEDATQTYFNTPTYVKVGPDGAVYVYDEGVVRRILPNGSTDHVAGGFNYSPAINPYVDGGIATEHPLDSGYCDYSSVVTGSTCLALDFDPQGNLFIAGSGGIYKLSLSTGIINTFWKSPAVVTDSLEDLPLANALVGTGGGTVFDIDDQGTIWLYGGTYNTGAAIQYVSPTDKIVRTIGGGGNNSNVQIASNSAIPGSLLNFRRDLGPGLYSISVDNGNIYYSALRTLPSGGPGNYIGKLTTLQDTTPPIISGSLTPSPNTNGWINSNGVVNWGYSDPDSPILSTSNCSPVNIQTDTPGTTYTCTATSVGGTSSQTVTVKRDTAAPTTSVGTISGGIALPLLGTLIIGSASATITSNVSDNLSGVAYAEYYFDTDPGQGHATSMTISGSTATGTASTSTLSTGQHTLYVRSRDAAGNWSTTATTTIIKI